MEEIWEVIKSVKTQSKIKIDTEVSNEGNVRIIAYYNDKEIKKYDLSLGEGLYLKTYKEGHEICISNCGGLIYRYVYFMKYTGHKKIKGYQIHHIDYNHCNNSIDNLLYCSPKEHGNLHKFQYKLGIESQGHKPLWTNTELKQLSDYNKALEYYSWLDNNKEQFSIEKAHEYMRQIRNEIEQLAIPFIEQYKIERIKQKEQDKINKEYQKYLDKLNSGNYKEVDGKLVRVMSEWQKERMAEGRRRNCYNNPEWRKRRSETVKQYNKEHPHCNSRPSKQKDKIGISKGTERKYIYPTELNRYLEQGWHKGFKL